MPSSAAPHPLSLHDALPILRQREMGVRLALGASRPRIARLLLVENLLLAGFGVALGAAIAAWATNAMRAVPVISSFPIRFQTEDRKSTRLNSSHRCISYAVFRGSPPTFPTRRSSDLAPARDGRTARARRQPSPHCASAAG